MSLPIEHLLGFGLSRQVINVWRSNGITHLLPLQEKALAEHGFLHGRNLLVLASTSSGKTFVAEIAALKHLEQNRRVIYLVPTKALAEEKYRAFTALYGPLGYRVAVATRERPETDALVAKGRFDLLIAVYEKMKSYLVTQPDLLSKVALVVADEIQMLGEPDRGATMDLLLTKIRFAPAETQFIGLSAVLGEDASRLAAWLNCDLLIYRKRPVELREGVVDISEGIFHYRCLNSSEYGEERLLEHPPDLSAQYETDYQKHFQREALLAIAEELAGHRGEQVLIFVPTKPMCWNWAYQLSHQIPDLPAAQDALDELNCHEDTHSLELIRQVLTHCIAFHNADLPWDLRVLIERHFNSGAIRVLIATSTLSQGVNLVGHNVLQVPDMVQASDWTGRTITKPLARSRFRNQGGRSARFRIAQPETCSLHPETCNDLFGRSLLVARNRAEAQRLLRDYVEGAIEDLPPQLTPDNLQSAILDLMKSGVAIKSEDITRFFLSTFAGRTFWQADSPQIKNRIEQTIEELIQADMLKREKAKLSTTGIGEVIASTGLCPQTVSTLAQWIGEPFCAFPHDSREALLVFAATPDGRKANGITSGSDSTAIHCHELIIDRLSRTNNQSRTGILPVPLAPIKFQDHTQINSNPTPNSDPVSTFSPTLQSILFPAGGLRKEDYPDFKKALLLDAWISPMDTREIEEQFNAFSGAIQNLAGQFAWIAQGATALARSLSCPAAIVEALDALGERLALGCAPEGIGLRHLHVPALSRTCIQALLREGYQTTKALAEADPENLSRIIPPILAEELILEARRLTNSSRKPRFVKYANVGWGKVREEYVKEAPANQPPPISSTAISSSQALPDAAPPIPSTSDCVGWGIVRKEYVKEAPTNPHPPIPAKPISSPQALPDAAPPLPCESGITNEMDILLEIDTRGTGSAKLNGQTLKLTPLPFRLLEFLAQKPGVGASRTEIHQYLWPEGKVEDQQIDSHARRIMAAFSKIIPPAQARQILIKVRGRGLHLNLPPESIKITRDIP